MVLPNLRDRVREGGRSYIFFWMIAISEKTMNEHYMIAIK